MQFHVEHAYTLYMYCACHVLDFMYPHSHSQICLIPASAHGTNPASAAMAGLKVVEVPTNKEGVVSKEAFNQKVVCMCLCLCVSVCACVCVSLCVCVSVYMYVYVCLSVCPCMSTCFI